MTTISVPVTRRTNGHADRAIQETDTDGGKLSVDLAHGIFSHRGTIHDDHVGTEPRIQAGDDLAQVLVGRYANHHVVDLPRAEDARQEASQVCCDMIGDVLAALETNPEILCF